MQMIGRFLRTAVSISEIWNRNAESPVSTTARRLLPTASCAPIAIGRPLPIAPQFEDHIESRGGNWTSAEAHSEAPPPSRIRIESAGRTLVASIGTRPGWIGIDALGT